VQISHSLIHDLLACRSDANAKAHDRVAVNAGHSLDTADAVPLAKHRNHRSFLFNRERVHITA
jgi:hypothetical protein